MTPQSWTIGSAADCQIQVPSETVSGHHCRLRFDGHQLTLEDLHSTNGTFVNGQLLEGIQVVTLQDRITLGRTLPIPWPDCLKPAETIHEPAPARTPLPRNVILTIGRGSQNDVVLNESNVSTVHARLTISPSKVILEDLGSTNGTSVGTVENKVHRAEIRLEDTLFFGSSAYTVTDLIQTAEAGSNPAALPQETPRQSSHRLTGTLAKAGLAAVAVALLTLVGWGLFRGTGDQSTAKSATPHPQPASISQTAPQETTTEKTTQQLSPEEFLTRSLFVIVATDPARETPFRLGTGFAIDSQHVATTASVISALRDLQQNGFSSVFLYSPATGEELEFAKVIVHPDYQSANETAQRAQSEYESIMDKYEAEPPPPEQMEAVKAQLSSAQERALQAIERKTSNDVAVLEMKKPLNHWLSGVESDVNLRPNLKLDVRGLAFDLEDPFFDPQDAIKLATMSSRVRQLTRLSPEMPPRLLAGGTTEQSEVAYFGSPALNSQGQVVAVYSRQTPPANQTDVSRSSNTFDAPLFERVRECLHHRP